MSELAEDLRRIITDSIKYDWTQEALLQNLLFALIKEDNIIPPPKKCNRCIIL